MIPFCQGFSNQTNSKIAQFQHQKNGLKRLEKDQWERKNTCLGQLTLLSQSSIESNKMSNYQCDNLNKALDDKPFSKKRSLKEFKTLKSESNSQYKQSRICINETPFKKLNRSEYQTSQKENMQSNADTQKNRLSYLQPQSRVTGKDNCSRFQLQLASTQQSRGKSGSDFFKKQSSSLMVTMNKNAKKPYINLGNNNSHQQKSSLTFKSMQLSSPYATPSQHYHHNQQRLIATAGKQLFSLSRPISPCNFSQSSSSSCPSQSYSNSNSASNSYFKKVPSQQLKLQSNLNSFKIDNQLHCENKQHHCDCQKQKSGKSILQQLSTDTTQHQLLSWNQSPKHRNKNSISPLQLANIQKQEEQKQNAQTPTQSHPKNDISRLKKSLQQSKSTTSIKCVKISKLLGLQQPDKIIEIEEQTARSGMDTQRRRQRVQFMCQQNNQNQNQKELRNSEERAGGRGRKNKANQLVDLERQSSQQQSSYIDSSSSKEESDGNYKIKISQGKNTKSGPNLYHHDSRLGKKRPSFFQKITSFATLKQPSSFNSPSDHSGSLNPNELNYSVSNRASFNSSIQKLSSINMISTESLEDTVKEQDSLSEVEFVHSQQNFALLALTEQDEQ